MMGEHPSYHQCITSREAERRLKMPGKNCYLTRYSKSQQAYVLSIYRKQRPHDVIEHLGIIIEEDGKHRVKGREDEEFPDITKLLNFYEKERIDPGFPNIGVPYTEEEFNEQQDELDNQEKQREEEKEAEKVRLAELEAENQTLIEEADRIRKELQDTKDAKQQALDAAEQKRLRDVQDAKKCTIL